VLLLYERLPSPPESVTEILPRIVASVISNTPALYVVFVPAEKCARTFEAELSILACASARLGPVYVYIPVPLLYVNDPSPPLSVTPRLALALAVVKYKFEPSAKSAVSSPARLLGAPVTLPVRLPMKPDDAVIDLLTVKVSALSKKLNVAVSLLLFNTKLDVTLSPSLFTVKMFPAKLVTLTVVFS
jgi:hypothetical protein